MKNAPETARGRKPPKPQILDNLPRKSGALSLVRRRPTVASTTISHVRRGVSRIERPRRQPRFRSADMTADRSGGTSTGSLYTGRLSTVRQCYTAVDVPSGCVCAGIRTTVERTGVRWASCRPSMRVCPDIPASNPRKTVPHLRGKHRRRPEHKPDITTRLRPHCNSPQPQHGPDGIACTTR